MPESHSFIDASTPPSTQRLYYDDAGMGRFSAIVVGVAGEGHKVYLDRTAFYPTSGGQPHDTGLIADVPVIDVTDEGELIAHHLAEPLGLPIGAMVVGQIDMERRFDHMQQHTGQHLLSALLADNYGWPTVSVHFGDSISTIDVVLEPTDTRPSAATHSGQTDRGVATETITDDLLAKIERQANAIAIANHGVTITYEDSASASGLRKPSDRDGMLRIVTIDGVDRSACGGTHVSSTGEIGAMLLGKAERTKGNWRIEFVCGYRALRQARENARLLSEVARPLSAAVQDAPAIVAQLQQRAQDLEREQRRLRTDLARHEAAALWNSALPDENGIRRIRVTASGSAKSAEVLAQQLIALGGCLVLVVGGESKGGESSVLFAAAEGAGVDAGKALRAALGQLGGRGGGSSRIAQGTVPGGDGELSRVLGF